MGVDIKWNVFQFSEEMKERMVEKVPAHGDGDVSNITLPVLLAKFGEEMGEVHNAAYRTLVADDSYNVNQELRDMQSEAVDVANMAMMIWLKAAELIAEADQPLPAEDGPCDY